MRSYYQHYKNLIQLGVPIVIGQLGMIILGFADTIMIGQYSKNALGASGFVNNLFNLIIIGATGFAYGLTPQISAYFGMKNHRGISRIFKNAIAVNFSVGILLTAVMSAVYLNIDIMGQPEELIPLIKPYFLILLVSIIPILLFNAFRQFCEGITDTTTPMLIIFIGNLFNILLNWLLIYGHAGCPELGLFGAGIATLSARFFMLASIICVICVKRKFQQYLKWFYVSHINQADFILLNKLGWPLALQMGMETSAFCLSAVMVGWIGTDSLAAHQIVLTISATFFMIYYGMGAATSVRISFFLGQDDFRNLKKTAFAGFHLILFIALISNMIFWQFRKDIGHLFTDNPTVFTLVCQVFLPLVLYQFGDCLQITFANALRGIMDVKILMPFSFFAYFIVSLPLSYFLSIYLELGLMGIWMAFPFGLTSAGLLFFIRFLAKTNRTNTSPP